MTNIEKVQKVLSRGKYTTKEISERTNMNINLVGATISRMRARCMDLSNHLVKPNGPKQGETRLKIIQLRKEFLESCGFFPKNSWVARKIGISRERVGQLVDASPLPEDYESILLRGAIRLHKDFVKEINQIKDEMDVSFSEALQIFSYRYKVIE